MIQANWQKTLRRNARAAAAGMLPKSIAHQWIRNTLNLAVPRSQSSLSFEVLSTTPDIKAALQLVQRSFEREGYARKTASGLRLTPYHLLPETMVIAAKRSGRIVATMSIIPRTSFGIPLDSCFAIDSFLSDKGRVVEISALAVDSASRGHHGEVLYNLMKFMYHCSLDVLGAQTEVIGVNPKMTALYEAVLLFEPVPGAKRNTYDFANGAPVVPMYFGLDGAEENYAPVYGGKPQHLNLMEFFLLPPPDQFSLPSRGELAKILPQRDPKKLGEMLSWDRIALRGLSASQKAALEALYEPWPACAALIRESIRG